MGGHPADLPVAALGQRQPQRHEPQVGAVVFGQWPRSSKDPDAIEPDTVGVRVKPQIRLAPRRIGSLDRGILRWVRAPVDEARSSALASFTPDDRRLRRWAQAGVWWLTAQLLIDSSEERLKTEFAGVTRFYVPLHSVLRIDEVEKAGRGRITSGDGKVAPFPMPIMAPSGKKDGT